MPLTDVWEFLDVGVVVTKVKIGASRRAQVANALQSHFGVKYQML